VIDLMKGQVVRAVAGRRSEYRAMGEPLTVANWLVQQFAFDMVYAADLDSIMRGQSDRHSWRQIAEAGLALWLDAGIGTLAGAKLVMPDLLRLSNAPTMIVGLESLVSLQCLSDMVQFLGAAPLAFSLDLNNGKLMTAANDLADAQPMDIVQRAISAGVQRLIVLDLADVGVGGGTRTLALCRQIRGEFRGIELTAGGGVRGIDDLRALADAGCDAALVASALHDGRLTPEDVREVENWRR
jgi:phosphoribosylformimino-5-aminoimidazole carboxamide ribotide isomerase